MDCCKWLPKRGGGKFLPNIRINEHVPKRSKKEFIGGNGAPYGYDPYDTGHMIRNYLEHKGIKLIRFLHEKGNFLPVICRELEVR